MAWKQNIKIVREKEELAEEIEEKEEILVYITAEDVEGWLSGNLVDSAQLETLVKEPTA